MMRETLIQKSDYLIENLWMNLKVHFSQRFFELGYDPSHNPEVLDHCESIGEDVTEIRDQVDVFMDVKKSASNVGSKRGINKVLISGIIVRIVINNV